MSTLKTFTFTADTAGGTYRCATPDAPSGDYVPAAVAIELEQTLSKLVWTTIYGKSFDATQLAMAADDVLGRLKAAA